MRRYLKEALLWFLQWWGDEDVKSDVLDSMTKSTQRKVEEGKVSPEHLKERQQMFIDEMEEIQNEIADRFLRRSKCYLILLFVIFIIHIIFVSCLSMITVPQIGALIALVGSLILGLAVIQGPYKIYGIIWIEKWGGKGKYLKISLINDTIDGVWGVSYLVFGFALQLFGHHIPVLIRIPSC